MPSRRPPSLRDPTDAAQRLGGTVQQILPGAKVRNSKPVPSQVAQQVAAGRTVLGTGEVEFDFSSNITAGSAAVAASSASIDTWSGDLDLAVSGASIDWAVTRPALYILAMSGTVTPLTNIATTDLHRITISASTFGEFVFVSASTWSINLAQAFWVYQNPGSPTTAYYQALCTGGTNRTYGMSSLFLDVIRLAL
jgi:hypothetical protein